MRQPFTSGPTWAGSGINYGNDRAFPQYYNAATIVQELTFLRKYFNKVRIFVPHYEYGTSHSIVNRCLFMIDAAVALGFQEIVWGITCSEATFTAARYPTYVSAAVARATTAQSHGVTTFVIGNEEDYHVDGTTLTKAAIQSHIQNDLYTSVKAAFGGTVSYNLAAGVLSDWLASGKGQLDRLGMNVYGNNEYDGAGFCRDVRNFRNAFGTTAYVSEYGLHYDWTQVTMTDQQQYFELKKRHDFIKNIGVDAGYFFLFSHLATDHFAVKLSTGKYRSMWQALIRERRMWVGANNQPVYALRQKR